MQEVTIDVNGKSVTAEVEPNTLLVDFIRKNLGLTGTHVGCDTAQCGACVVLMNGDSVKSCNTLAVQADGGAVTTIEGLAEGRARLLNVAIRKTLASRGIPAAVLTLDAGDLARLTDEDVMDAVLECRNAADLRARLRKRRR